MYSVGKDLLEYVVSGMCLSYRENLCLLILLKGTVYDSGERLLIVELNRQSDYTPLFRAHEAIF